MLWHWERLRQPWASETRGGYVAIEGLRDALQVALPYVEWPFGKHEKQDYRKAKRPKIWHGVVIEVAGVIGKALEQSGRRRARSYTRNSVLVRVVRQALIRMGHGKNIEPSAIAAYLENRIGKFSMTAKRLPL
jgi:hypothetical protein